LLAFLQSCVFKNTINIVFLSVGFHGMTKLRVTRMNHSMDENDSIQSIFIYRSNHRTETVDTSVSRTICTSMTRGRMEFRFSELRRACIHELTCLGRLCHPANIGLERSPPENCSPLYENARMRRPTLSRMSCDNATLWVSTIAWL